MRMPMASVEKRQRDGKVSWRARYRDPSGKQLNRSFTRKVDAERFLTSIESSKLTGSFVDPGRAKATFGAVADQWLAGKVNLKATGRARYESALNVHVLPRWKATPLDRIEHSDIQAWVSELAAAGQSGASVRKSFGVLRGVLALAVRDRRLPVSPAAGINLPPLNAKRRRYLTATQVTDLATAATKLPEDRYRWSGEASFDQYRLAVYVLAYCGLRWSELAALKVGRVDLMRRRLNIAEAVTEVNGGRLEWGTPKSHEARSVPIPSFLVDEMMGHLAGKSAEDLVFTGSRGAVLRNRAARRAWFDRAAEAIGQADLTPHELRHTAASLAVSAGANVKAVQRMLGHASAALTLDTYADLFDDDLDAVAERLDVVARKAGVSRMCPEAEIVDLASVKPKARGQ